MTTVVGSNSIAPPEVEKRLQKTNASFRPRHAPKWMLLVAALTMLVSGTYDSIASKWMNKQKLPPCAGCTPRYFEGPFLQTLTMYIGQFFCLVLYWGDGCISKRKGTARHLDFPNSAASFNKPHCPVYWWLVPAVLDLISSSMINYALIFCQASTVQMLRNFNVILTAILTMAYLRLGLRVHQWFGVFLITVGLVLIGVYAFLNPDEDTNYKNMEWLGVVMAVGGTILAAFQFVFEESLFRKYYASTFEAVGFMGVYGSLITAVILIIGQYANFEDSRGNFYMMGLRRKESTYLILANISFVVSILFFNAFGLMVTKLGSGLLRAIMFSARTFTVWVMELLLKWNTFDALNFCGLLVILFGVFMYNYNYLVRRKGAWVADKLLKTPLVCCGVRNPDAEEIVALEDKENRSLNESNDSLAARPEST